MQYLNREDAVCKITEYAVRKKPFLMVIDYLMNRNYVTDPEEALREGIFFNINGTTNSNESGLNSRDFSFELFPVDFSSYKTAFDKVLYHLHRGDTYLINLTFPTPIRTTLSLKELFHRSHAPYKLLFNDQFVVFSPEIFIRISEDRIFSFPMKGTIDASKTDAENIIISDPKEFSEHNTIVDLIRNDLSMVSTGIKVNRFRYIDRIRTNRKELLQVSSEISGVLNHDWRSCLGEILFTLLPAGSVTGAPKEKTCDIIREVETYERGFYTGIFGYFNGEELDTAVNIRFIEDTGQGMVFKSGGGITARSDVNKEYEELIQKVYVPLI